MNRCGVCHHSDNHPVYTVREMMFGSRDEFEYFECLACGCLQIAEVPQHLSSYYPAGYYSYAASRPNPIKRYFKRVRARSGLGYPSLLGNWLTRRFGTPMIASWARYAGIGFNDAILDVGSGAGQHLLDMADAGFTNLTGIDPFIDEDIFYPNGPTIYKKELKDLDETYAFVMLHHAFEHMPHPEEALFQIHRVLAPGRIALIRIPVAGTYAWKTYTTDWVQLDAPRHLFLHTVKSMQVLAEKTGFEVQDVIFDSNALQFWGSEQYQQDIPYRSDRSYRENPDQAVFSIHDIQRFEKRSQQLNEQNDGDQACFYLKRTGSSPSR